MHVAVVEVGFLDTRLRSGWGQEYFRMEPPWVPGAGVAGVIAVVGEGVSVARVGTSVATRTGSIGAYAEQVAVPDRQAVAVPAGLDPAVAVAALHDGPLALDRLQRAGLRPGSRVLVTAAAGSLGPWFVPLAKAAGAEVVGAAGGVAKVAAVRALGVDAAVDYLLPHWVGRAAA